MRDMGLPAPAHPLIALVDYNKVSKKHFKRGIKISLDFYKISFKNEFRGKVRYGQSHYDFEEGGLAFLKPQQIVFAPVNLESYEGYVLYFHPDFIRNYALGGSIHNYGFFSYSVAEALFLSTREKEIIKQLYDNIAAELKNNIDAYSQDVLVSQLELLLNYSNRFYNRQFITRKTENHDIITELDSLLKHYFESGKGLEDGLPSVHYISAHIPHSQRYLSDLLRSLTGMNTRQYVQNKVIEYSKDLLTNSSQSVSEIAFQLGFGHPQSFSKLFKNKTNQSPLEFRASFN